MKAARFVDGRLSLVEEPVPQIKSGEVLINVKAAAICGSDQKILQGKKKAAPNTVLGHEVAGVVEALGEGVTDLSEGDRVAVFPSITCGECIYCRAGRTNICQSKRTIGYALDGGFAQYLLIPQQMVEQGCLVALPPKLSFDEGALMEPLSCCISSLEHTGLDEKSHLLIVGGGPMGQLHVITAKALGAERVFLTEPDEGRRQVALELGADRVINPEKEAVEGTVLRETGGHGADICILCVGNALALKSTLKSVRKRGAISLFASFSPNTQGALDLNIIHYEELILTGTHSTTVKQFRDTVALVQEYGIDLRKVITHRFPLEQIHVAFDVYTKHEGLKVVVKPGGTK
jgi:L-iditol 2-dehydrogenase